VFFMMNIVSELLGLAPRERESTPRISSAPSGVKWRFVRPKSDAHPVRAELAQADGELPSQQGALSYKKGEHYIVEYGDEDRAPVRRTIFERTYRQRADGRYEKRSDVVLRYFTLPYPAMIETLEGVRRAEPRDWIMVGVVGEMWPISPDEARRKYKPA
jgi:hypothetical protein